MVVLHLRKSQASAKAKYYGFGRKGCSERPRLVLRNIPSRCEQVISYVDDLWIVIYSTSIKTGRRRQTSCDSRDPRPPNYSRLQYSHLPTPRTHNPSEARPSPLGQRQKRADCGRIFRRHRRLGCVILTDRHGQTRPRSNPIRQRLYSSEGEPQADPSGPVLQHKST